MGVAFALWWTRLTHQPECVTLIDRAPASASLSDPRTLALSAGSLQLLGEFCDVQTLRGVDIHRVHVSQRGHLGRVCLNASEFGVPTLGKVVRYADLMSVLLPLLEKSGVKVERPRTPDSVLGQFVVHAEGGVFDESSDRSKQPETRHDYGQTALVGEVLSSRVITSPTTAYERFTAQGPLALLPALPSATFDENRLVYAYVWCVTTQEAARLQALADVDFCHALQSTFGQRLGRLSLISARSAFPLGLVRRDRLPAHHVAIGNASQILHPVAGQGLNLGLRDAYQLSRCLASGAGLENFSHLRHSDRNAMVGMTDFLARGFTQAFPLRLAQHFAGGLLTGLGVCSGARRILGETFMFGRR